MSFSIHKQLLSDSHYLGRFSGCHVLLHKNSLVPWFILVPETDENDLLSLSVSDREKIMDICSMISTWLKQYFKLSKINFAAIGNIVPQLHVHIIGRWEGDACWPGPVWGNLESSSDYTDTELETIKQKLLILFSDHEDNDPGC